LSNNELQNEVTDKFSLRGRVFNRIREDILAGKFKQNEELKETAIAGDLGVSRTPVREALRQLELEGLVNIIPNKGAYVTGITAQDIKDIYSIRSLLEGLCARWATEYITEEKLEELDEITYLTEFHVQKKHYEQVLELDNKFHEILYKASKSKQLHHMLSDFHHYVQRVRKITLSSETRAAKTNEEHKKIVEALKEKNPDKAEALANEHIMNTIKNISDCGLENILKQAEE
jgi:DNA-binding GntR family transcriptional regulator